LTQSELENKKKALVTGASRGIGAAIALQLAKDGYEVIGTATSEAGAQSITDALDMPGCRGAVLVLGTEATEADVQQLVADYGPFEILVHNAGMSADNLLLRLKASDWQKVIDVSLTSFYYLAKACSRNMIKKRSGRIIALSSVVGRLGNPGQCHYAAAKAGLEGMARSLALEVSGRGVTVNTIAPGFIETDMTKALPDEQREKMLSRTPVGHFGSTQDIAYAVSFLVSDKASFITGATLPVNGGLLMN
jgi:3-oxoacyl-[acyl-carrier protein] reductase